MTILVISVLALLWLLLRMYKRRGDTMHDMLTGLPSSTYFQRYLQNCIARAARNPSYRFGILILDIRGFADLRRTMGRYTADEIIADFAQRVRALIRPTDVFTRVDTDSFAILLEDVRGSMDVPRIAIRVHNSMKEIVTLAQVELTVEAIIGVTVSKPGMPQEAAELISQAMSALHRAIEIGRPYAIFDQEFEAMASRDLQLESELRSAIENNELTLGFQPFVDSASGLLQGFTALVRWTHPRRGQLQAREFIEIAEGSGQMLRIGEWVIDEAIRSLEAITVAAGRPIVLTVNIGLTELERGELVERLSRALGDHPWLAGWLRIELPAQLLFTRSALVASTADRLRAIGVTLHIDHANGGLPVWQAIRVNPAGIRIDLAALDASDALALTRVVAACRPIAPEIVVEGIETEAVEDAVRSLDPPVWAQGYRIGWPMSLDDALVLARGVVVR